MLGFAIWAGVGILVISLGIFSFFSKKPVGFWANIRMFEVSDCKKYNGAVGKLLILFGVVFIMLGMPLLKEQNTPFILFSIVGIMIESIAAMVIYTQIIEKKYRKEE